MPASSNYQNFTQLTKWACGVVEFPRAIQAVILGLVPIVGEGCSLGCVRVKVSSSWQGIGMQHCQVAPVGQGYGERHCGGSIDCE